MGKGNSMIMKGLSSEESEEVFDDEIQSTSTTMYGGDDTIATTDDEPALVDGSTSRGKPCNPRRPQSRRADVPTPS